MAFDKSEVSKVAQLARLKVTEEEIDDIESRITDILLLIDQMQLVDTDSVVPMSHPLDGKQILRSDTVSEENHRDELQKLAPKVENGLFLVPKVIE
tara:strand:- start:176 stop:463 length:288 start_codon:yes stop_codon:yes gene_type:complete